MSRYPAVSADIPPSHLSHAPVRSAWLGFLPVAALGDKLRQMTVETEEGVEVDEVEEGLGTLSYADLPIVFNCPRHRQEADKIELMTQVGDIAMLFEIFIFQSSTDSDLEDERAYENGLRSPGDLSQCGRGPAGRD